MTCSITLDNKVLETYFLSRNGDCLSGPSLQIGAEFPQGAGDGLDNRSAEADQLAGTAKLFCIPNPATDNLTVLFDAANEYDQSILIHDMSGRLLQILPWHFAPGRNVIVLNDFAQLPAGLLNISVFDGTKVHSARVEKY